MNRRLPKWINAFFTPIRWFLRTLFPLTFVKLQYRYITGKKLNLKTPTTWTEKLQYLRLVRYPHDPLVTQCTDRVGVRAYLRDCALESYLVPSLGVFDSYTSIPFNKLPRAFVMKCTHASGFNVIILDKTRMNHKRLQKQFSRWLKINYGKQTVEMHYANIPPKIMIEPYLGKGNSLPLEYKLHVFNGRVRYLYVVSGRGHDIRYTHFLEDWTPFPEAQFNGWKEADYPLLEPKLFPTMKHIAENLAQPFPFVRVDFYLIDEKIYVSELTFTPAKGTLNLVDPTVDTKMGTWLTL